ncbi:hypothetical protein Pint_20519 [Pistacia integerrima]|uniref:Uncharacterized protein n=1 Tax=Pistacia integerrima TaxID=434235 RepID=A0ACC0XG28_9ROSI|nr:hypothetical protein Pint_20519 [Pistacia integerrima]
MAEEKIKIRVPRVKLGNQGLEVSKLGYGCMTLSGGYNSPLSEEEGIAALKQLPREKIQLATKFGILGLGSTDVKVKGTPEYVRSACEGSLQRLGVEYIDLYYQHRIDTSIPIEETVSDCLPL